MRSKFALLVLLVLMVMSVANGNAQAPGPTEWHTIVSRSSDFSVSIPFGYIVHNNSRSNVTTIVGSSGGASFETSFRRGSSGFGRPEDIPKQGSLERYEIGENRVQIYTFPMTKFFRRSISVETKKGFYRTDLSALTSDNVVLSQIAASLKVAGVQVVRDSSGELPTAGSTLKADELQSSEIVKAAMKRKQTEEVPLVIAPPSYEPETNSVMYSRRLIVLYKEPAPYNSRARNDGVEGVIRARVLFKGNGNIGKVTILKGLPSGLNEQVLQAVKNIKFLPAEVDGKPADAEATLEYTFDIY